MSNKEKVIIVDLDGTLADCEHRVHHLHGDNKDWHSFYSGLGQDDLNSWCKQLMDAMKHCGVPSIIVTGRDEKYRQETESWLKKYDISYQSMFMRATNDHRNDSDIKKDIFNKEIKDKFDVVFVVDDRKSVVTMWRDIGQTCLQCDWGDF